MAKTLKIGMCGCHEGNWHLIQTLLQQGVKFDYFISLTEEQGRQYNVSGYKGYEDLAERYNIPIYYVENYSLNSSQDQAFFEEHQFDMIILGGWQRLIPQTILSTLSLGAIGVHGSADFLPRGRGRSPLNWSLIENKKRFIVHIFLLKPEADDGDIIDTATFQINPFDTIRTLYQKMAICQEKLILDAIQNCQNGTLKLTKQEGTPSYYAKRTPEDGKILWEEWDAETIYNAVRAQTHPYPGAFTYIGNEKVYIWEAYPFDNIIHFKDARYGEVVKCYDNELIINCLGGLLRVVRYDASVEAKVGDICVTNRDN